MQTQKSSQEPDNPQQSDFKYYSLIQSVGTRNKYQILLVVSLVIIFFMSSLTSNNASFIWMNPQFDCYARGIVTQNCEEYVCSNYSQQQISAFPRIIKYQTIATELGPFYCKDNYKLAFYRGVQSIGTFFGLLMGMIFSDNVSRKATLNLSLISMTTGSLLLSLSINIFMVCFSLFLVGLGHSIAMRTIQIMISEQTQKKLAKRILSTSLISFTLATMLVGQIFAITSNWRTFALFFCFIPYLLVTFFVMYLLEDSPKYLLKKEEEKAVESLNRIARINGFQFRYKIGDLTQSIQREKTYKQIHQVYTPIDIFRYGSLRRSSIAFCFIFFCTDFFFLANNALIGKVGFGEITNSYIFGFSSLIGLFISFMLAPTVPRKLSGIISFGSLTLVYGFLIFFQVSDECQECERVYIQIIFIAMGFIFFIFQTSIIYIHFIEFFPVSIRSIGLGIPNLFGSIGMFCSQLFIVSALQLSLSLPFVIMSGISVFGLINYFFTTETLNGSLKDQIEQIYDQRNQANLVKSQHSE